MRRRLAGLIVLPIVAAIALVPGVAAALSPITPDNSPTPVPGYANGQLPDALLRWVAPRCSLEAHAAPSMAAMLSDARAAGVGLVPNSCYRDLAGQIAAREYWCSLGLCQFAAVPGTSKHGWGKAADFGDGSGDLTFTSPGYLWLKANAWRYGWNHPGWAEPDGTAPEPWHWEWVGDGGTKYPGLVYPTPMGSGIVIGGTPIGTLDAVVADGPGRVRAVGWALDPDVEHATTVHVYLDGARVFDGPATGVRGDVAAAYPGYEATRGYAVPVDVGLGRHTICVWAINTGLGTVNPMLGCREVVVTGVPVGAVDLAAVIDGPSGARLLVQGWAIDPDAPASIPVHIYLDGVGVSVDANLPRNDLAAAFPRYGGAHGFAWLAPVSHGTHTVCAYGISVLADGNGLLGCRTVRVDREPRGALDAVTVTQTPAGAVIGARGWALDPDTALPIPVHIYTGSSGVAVTADQLRPDVGAAFPLYGDARGFEVAVGASPGSHTVCAYGINVGDGTINTLLGCRRVVISRDPLGAFDSVTVTNGLMTASGWAIDPDTAAPIAVHVYIDGAGHAVTADAPRADVGAAFPGYGAAHGWQTTVSVGPGSHRVCAHAIGAPVGTPNVLLGCRTFVT